MATLNGITVNVGDRVWSPLYGWGTVTEVNSGIEVHFERTTVGGVSMPEVQARYRDEGVPLVSRTKMPMLFWDTFAVSHPPRPVPKIDWTKVPPGTPVSSGGQPYRFAAYLDTVGYIVVDTTGTPQVLTTEPGMTKPKNEWMK